MTAQEAIQYLEHYAYISDEVKDIAIKALEKQSIKIAVKKEFYGDSYIVCPTCGYIMGSQEKYCCECGQRVIYDSENEE